MSRIRAKKTRFREGHKAVTSHYMKEVDNLLSAVAPGRPADANKLAQLRLSLQEKLEKFGKLDNELFELIDDGGELICKIDQANMFRQSIYTTVAKLDNQSNSKVYHQLHLTMPFLRQHLRAMRDCLN